MSINTVEQFAIFQWFLYLKSSLSHFRLYYPSYTMIETHNNIARTKGTIHLTTNGEIKDMKLLVNKQRNNHALLECLKFQCGSVN